MRAAPTKVPNIGSDAESDLDDPDLDEPEYFAGGHLEVIAGTIETLETVLSQRRDPWSIGNPKPAP